MLKLGLQRIVSLIVIILLVLSCSDRDVSELKNKKTTPKNVILFISDGCGFNHIDATSYYQYGKTGEQAYEKFPVKLAVSTYHSEGPVYDPDSAWINVDALKQKPTDSAASGTALATGHRTYYGSISYDTLRQPLENLVDNYEKEGKSTGVISTVPFSNATPAVFVAHNESRQHYLEISKEMVMQSGIDVIMGGGHPFYDLNGGLVSELAARYVGEKEKWDMNQGGKPISTEDGKLIAEAEFRYVGGREVWELLSAGVAGSDADGDGKDDAWTFIQDRESFQKYMQGETPERLLGVFKCGQTTQITRGWDNDNGQPYSAPLIETVPTLTEMTLAGINVLDENKTGFFLMVEGGAVDWAAHDQKLNRTIEEQIDFNMAVEAACEWVDKNSSWDETLIVVTADHETGYLAGPGSFSDSAQTISEKWKPIINNGKNQLPGVEWHSKSHTNLLVPLFAKGSGAELFLDRLKGIDPVYGNFIDNTDIGQILKSF